MKTGLQGLASKVDEVQTKAVEDVTALAHAMDDALSYASSVTSDLSARLTDVERQQAAAKAAAERAQAASDATVARVAAGPLLGSQRCARKAASPPAAGSPCNLLVAAAGGVVARRCTQVLSLVLAYGVGRLEQECTGLRARFTRRGYSVADRCYPRHNLTRALVRKASSQESRKEQ